MIWAIAITFTILGVIGMPLAFALGIAGLVGILVGDFPLMQLSGKMVHSIDSFPLMAIPLFMLAGQFMIRGGVMERIIDLANAMVGRIRGGLGLVTVSAAMGLSSVSGTAVADAAALGGTLGPSLSKAYGKPFGAALVAASSNLGPIIPPSAGVIVYAVLAENASVGAMFLAGIVPGILLGLAMMVQCVIMAYRRGYPYTGNPFDWREVALQLRRSVVVILMPVIVIGGIIGGIFTATEGAAVAVAYAFFIGFFVTKQLKLSHLPQALLNAGIISAVIGALIAFASQVTYLLTAEMVGVSISEWLTSISASPWVFISLVMALLIVVGMVMEANALFVMLVPILAPIAAGYGIDPVYFGFLFVMNVAIGGITPPVGIVLFVVSGIWKIRISQILTEIWPFVILQYAILGVLVAFPEIVLFVPRMFGY